jgi:tRNA threonylcarbamoyladenosine biosynthesis protein TsaB
MVGAGTTPTFRRSNVRLDTVLLAFDTATPAVTVALHDGERVVGEYAQVDARRHGELLAPGIAQVLGEAGASVGDLTAIAVGVGPGPFTGLRVGLVTARTLADALHLPLYGVCTLDVIAAEVECSEPFLVATDARRKEIYWARYDEIARRVEGPRVDRPGEVEWSGPAFGAGALMYEELFPAVQQPRFPSAAVLAEIVLGKAVMTLPPDPLYLRRPDAVEPAARKVVTQA